MIWVFSIHRFHLFVFAIHIVLVVTLDASQPAVENDVDEIKLCMSATLLGILLN